MAQPPPGYPVAQPPPGYPVAQPPPGYPSATHTQPGQPYGTTQGQYTGHRKDVWVNCRSCGHRWVKD